MKMRPDFEGNTSEKIFDPRSAVIPDPEASVLTAWYGEVKRATLVCFGGGFLVERSISAAKLRDTRVATSTLQTWRKMVLLDSPTISVLDSGFSVTGGLADFVARGGGAANLEKKLRNEDPALRTSCCTMSAARFGGAVQMQ